MKTCDLHTHSVYSDGTCTPKEIIDLAIDNGLSAVALCDHNTTDGLKEFLEEAENRNIEAIAGAEFSVDYNGTEVHLLGLFIPENQFDRVSLLMSEVHKRKTQSNIDLIKALNQAGYDIDYETVKNSTDGKIFNRVHVAAELTRKGYTSSIKQAFDTLLSAKSGYYTEPKRPTVFEMLGFLKEIGAVSVLAHPFLNLTEVQLQKFLPEAKERGLEGMECYYSLYNEKTCETSLLLADRFGLKYSGGSDFHGDVKPDINVGSGKGNLQIPYDWAINLKR